MPNMAQSRQQVNGNLRILANRLREQLDSICPRRDVQQEDDYQEDENNLSLQHQLEYGQGEYIRRTFFFEK